MNSQPATSSRTSSKTKRSKVSVTDGRWKKYVVAGLATAATVATGENLDADIHVNYVNTFVSDRTPGDNVWDFFGSYTFGDGGDAARIWFAHAVRGTSDAFAGFWPTGNISMAGFYSAGYNYASNIAYGANVSTAGLFGVVPQSSRGEMAWAGGYPLSEFLSPGQGFLGFRFDIGDGTQYGFAEVEMLSGPGQNDFQFVGYAWADPGESISTFSIVPEPGALGILAFGAAGLLAWRRSRKSHSSSDIVTS